MNAILLNLMICVPGFLLAIVCHEYAHAWVANKFGDDTATRLGRLTLNPMAHIDMMGTVIVPLVLLIFSALSGGQPMMFGWAKPVPVDPRRLKDMRRSVFWVSFGGPLANILLAVLSSFFLAFVLSQVPQQFYLFMPMIEMLKASLTINIVLAIFNLLPFPPLDGSNMLSAFLSYNMLRKYETFTRYTAPIFIILMFSGALSYVITPFLMLGGYLTEIFYSLMV